MSTTADGDGTYEFADLAPGSYKVRFAPPSGSALLSQWWNGKPDQATADVIELAADETRTEVDAQLLRPQMIGGRVTGPDGAPLEGVTVSVFAADFPFPFLVGSASTNADGRYAVQLFPGFVSAYDVRFSSSSPLNYAPEWWNDKPNQASADSVPVAPGQAAPGIDAQLAEGGSAVTGTITGQVTGPGDVPLAGATVSVVNAADPFPFPVAVAPSDADGFYTVPGLTGGTYKVNFYPPLGGNLTAEWWDDKPDHASADPVPIAPGETRFGIDAQLAQPGAIAGRVTGPGGVPLADAAVTIFDGGSLVGPPVAYASTDANGLYTVTGLARGTYRVVFSPPGPGSDLVVEWWNDKPDEVSADLVQVTPGETMSGIDAELEQGGKITGLLVGPEGLPLLGASVYAFDATTSEIAGYGLTDGDGRYTVPGLRAGAYKVQFNPPFGGNLVPEWWDDKPDQASADPVEVAPGETVANIDGTLVQGSAISGRVTGTDGSPVSFVFVYVFDAQTQSFVASGFTDADGRYTVANLPGGNYKVQFLSFGGNLVPEWWDDKPNQASADPVGVAPGETVSDIDAQLAQPGAITGEVTGPDGAPLAGVFVSVYNADSQAFVNFGSTDAAGRYTVTGLAAGSYKVLFNPPFGGNQAPEWWDDKPSQALADPVPVAPGETVSDTDAQLAEGGAISGRVTGPDGGPLTSATVAVYDAAAPGSSPVAFGSTDGDGRYTVSRLPEGTYKVEFSPPSGGGQNPEWWADKADEASADPVDVAPGETISGIDAQLTEGGRVTGRVVGPEGAPVDGVLVSVFDATSAVPVPVAVGSTGTEGRYTVSGLPTGPYKVQFNPPGSSFLPEWWNDKPDQASADPVTVVAGQTTMGIDAQLVAPPGSISGRVTDAAGNPLDRAVAVLYNASNAYAGHVFTDADGRYTVNGVAPGLYRVKLYGPAGTDHVPEWWNDTTEGALSTQVEVLSGQTAAGIDAGLAAGGSVSGRVTDASGTPLVQAAVQVFDAAGGYVSFAYTDADGRYTIHGLAPGSYRVRLLAPAGTNLLAEWWNDKPDQASADLVTVVANQTTNGVDASLALGGSISGRVTDAGGAPLTRAVPVLFTPSGTFAGYTFTDADGRYIVRGLAPGPYLVRLYGPAGTDHVPEWWDDTTDVASAQQVVVASGQTTPGIDAGLAAGGAVSGRVTDAGGGPLFQAAVQVFDAAGGYVSFAYTDADGRYTIHGLAPGSYRVRLLAPAGTDHLSEWWDDEPNQALADPVTVEVAQTTTVDAGLALGGAISGRVTDAAGNPLDRAVAVLYNASNAYAGHVFTDADGRYTVNGVAPGLYRVKLYGPAGTDHVPEWWNDTTEGALSTQVEVVSGQTAAGIDAALAAGGAAVALGLVTGEAA